MVHMLIDIARIKSEQNVRMISPDHAHDGKYHRISVVLAPPRGLPKLQAHWRTGYTAPVE